jgi:membrane fusion protein
MIRVVARTSGILQSLKISQGSRVEVGQELATLNLSSNINNTNVGVSLETAASAELEATIIASKATRSMLDDEVSNLKVQRRSLEMELATSSEVQANLRRRIELISSELGRLQTLQARGYVTSSNVDIKKAELLSAEQAVMQNQAAMRLTERQFDDIRLKLITIPKKLAELSATTAAQQAALEQKLTQVRAQSHDTLLAPISGTVATVQAELGQTVNAGNLITVINPRGGNLEAELFVPSRAIGFIRVGQEVALRFKAFPYQRYGIGKGEVKTISKTVIAPSDAPVLGEPIKEPVFRVRVSMTKQAVEAYGEAVPLQPGMLVDASVLLERRNILAFLFDPILAVSKRN